MVLQVLYGLLWHYMVILSYQRYTVYFFFFLSDLFCGAEVKSPFFPPLGGELAAASEDDSEHGIRPALPYFGQRQPLSVLHNKLCTKSISV